MHPNAESLRYVSSMLELYESGYKRYQTEISRELRIYERQLRDYLSNIWAYGYQGIHSQAIDCHQFTLIKAGIKVSDKIKLSTWYVNVSKRELAVIRRIKRRGMAHGTEMPSRKNQ